MATGMLTLDELKQEIAAGTIDTVVVAMVDLQGRLIGKRFHAEYFADRGHEETHGCNYLLGVDIEMEPVPGYKAASWDLGYGDFTLKPDLATLRRFPGCRAPRSCSATWSIITTRTCRTRHARYSRSSSDASRRWG